jgi:hypothetical protein
VLLKRLVVVGVDSYASRDQRQYTFSTSCESLGELHSLVQVFLVKGQP